MKTKLIDEGETLDNLKDELLSGYIKTHGSLGINPRNPLESQPLRNYANAIKLVQVERKT